MILLFLCVDIAIVAAGIRAIMAISATGWSPRTKAFSVLALSGGASLFIFIVSEPLGWFNDFRYAYYMGGSAVLSGPDALSALYEEGVIGWVNLPIVAYLFTPFALLPVNAAACTFSLLGLLSIPLSWLLLSRLAGLEGRDRWLLFFLFAVSGPLHYSAKEGNMSHVVLLGLCGGLFFLRLGRDVAAGLLLGAMAVIKLPLLLFGAAFILRRNWGAAFGFVVVCGAAALLSLAIFGLDPHIQWYERCVRQFANNPLGAFNVQSVHALVIRAIEGPSVLRDWDVHEIPFVQRLAGSALVAPLYLATLIVCLRRPTGSALQGNSAGLRSQIDIEYCLVICLATVSSPLSWSHYYVWLLVPIAFVIGKHSLFRGDPVAQRAAWVAIFLITPVVLLVEIENPVLMRIYTAIGVSYLLFGGLLLFALLVLARARLDMPTPSYKSVSTGGPAHDRASTLPA